MSLLDTASLIVTPNGYKEGKLYSVIPSDGSGDLSVTRATTATRVNSQGLVELVPYNLLQYSSSFSNAYWTKYQSSVTGGQTGYDGSTNAFLLADSTANDVHILQPNFTTSGQVTISVYAKANTLNWLWLRGVQNSANVRAWFNLSNGTIGNVETNGTANIESVGNGWYRCSLTIASHQSGFEFYVAVSNANGVTNYVGSGQSVYVQDAQLVEGSTAKAYQKTETRLNIPRLDYSNGTCPSILVEPQRTNVCKDSSNLGGANWINQTSNTTKTRINSGGADGGAYDRLVATGSGNMGRYVQYTSLSGSNAIFSVYLKGSGTTDIAIYNGGQSSLNTITLTNEWTRYETQITSGTSGYMDWSVWVYGGSTVEVSCAQMEFATYATSYIPTTLASVTRNADVISKTGISSLIGQTEGTLFFDIVFPQDSSASYIGISDGTTGNRIILGCESNTFYTFGYGFAVLPLSTNTPYKIAMAYNSTNMKIYANGSLIATVIGSVPSAMSRFAFDSGANTQHLIASVKAAALWKTKLSDTQLAQLTAL